MDIFLTSLKHSKKISNKKTQLISCQVSTYRGHLWTPAFLLIESAPAQIKLNNVIDFIRDLFLGFKN